MRNVAVTVERGAGPPVCSVRLSFHRWYRVGPVLPRMLGRRPVLARER